MSEERFTNRIYLKEVEGTRRRRRLNWKWKDGVNENFSAYCQNMQEVRMNQSGMQGAMYCQWTE